MTTLLYKLPGECRKTPTMALVDLSEKYISTMFCHFRSEYDKKYDYSNSEVRHQ